MNRDCDRRFLLRVDNRETRSGLTQQLKSRSDLEVKFEDLPVGDFLLSDDVVVERKAASDFVLSILDKRLFSQVQLMKAAYARAIVLIEGDVFATRSAIQPDALRGALSWLAVIEGVAVMTTQGPLESAACLPVHLARLRPWMGHTETGSLSRREKFMPYCAVSTRNHGLDHATDISQVVVNRLTRCVDQVAGLQESAVVLIGEKYRSPNSLS